MFVDNTAKIAPVRRRLTHILLLWVVFRTGMLVPMRRGDGGGPNRTLKRLEKNAFSAVQCVRNLSADVFFSAPLSSPGGRVLRYLPSSAG